MAAEPFDGIVLGAGEAGAEVATRALQAGWRVALVYREPWGGTCMNVGCIPTKFLLVRAELAHAVRTAHRFHIDVPEPRVDFASLMRDKDNYVLHHRDEGRARARSARDLTLIEGAARFVGPNEVSVEGRRLTAPRIVVATGERAVAPPLEGLDEVPWLSHASLLDLRELPEHLVVLGGGYIGLEFAQAFARLGSRVTLLEAGAQVLGEEEPEVGEVLVPALREEGLDVRLGATVQGVTRSGPGVAAHLEDGTVVEGSHLLVATGRKPNTDGLGVEAAGIALDVKGYITVDEQLRSSNPLVFAIGDVNGQQPFNRVAQEEAKVCYANAFEGASLALERGSIPHAVFTDPQVAAVGMTEAQAREAGHDVVALATSLKSVTIARFLGRTEGFVKVLADRRDRRLLGCTIVAPHGADLIWPLAVALRLRATVDDLATAVGVFPTLAEGVEGACRALLAQLDAPRAQGPLAVPPEPPA